MPDFEDYYETLQVHHLAEPEVIQKAYMALANKYHPDKNPGAEAADRMGKINHAYDVLKDPLKRKDYDAEWTRRKRAARVGVNKPKPLAEPAVIRFTDSRPKQVQRASFTVTNTGGSYKKIWFSNPDSWVKITNYFSLSDADELPLQVELEAAGAERNKDYVEFIRIKLDDEETCVRVELSTQAVPVVKPRPEPGGKFARFMRPVWVKVAVGVGIVAAVALIAGFTPIFSNISKSPTASAPAAQAPAAGQGSSQGQAADPGQTIISADPGGTLLREIDLSGVANSSISNTPGGFRTYSGIPFYVAPNHVFMARSGTSALPAKGILNIRIERPLEIYMLINSVEASREFAGKQTGSITLIFDNGATEKTNLIAGQDVHDYSGADSSIEMLTLPVSDINQARILTQVVVEASSDVASGSSGPGLVVWGVTAAQAADINQ